MKFKHQKERHKEREFIRSENKAKGDEHKKKIDQMYKRGAYKVVEKPKEISEDPLDPKFKE